MKFTTVNRRKRWATLAFAAITFLTGYAPAQAALLTFHFWEESGDVLATAVGDIADIGGPTSNLDSVSLVYPSIPLIYLGALGVSSDVTNRTFDLDFDFPSFGSSLSPIADIHADLPLYMRNDDFFYQSAMLSFDGSSIARWIGHDFADVGIVPTLSPLSTTYGGGLHTIALSFEAPAGRGVPILGTLLLFSSGLALLRRNRRNTPRQESPKIPTSAFPPD